jgi:hypothetical protein
VKRDVLSVHGAFEASTGRTTPWTKPTGRRFQLSGQGAAVLHKGVKRIARHGQLQRIGPPGSSG